MPFAFIGILGVHISDAVEDERLEIVICPRHVPPEEGSDVIVLKEQTMAYVIYAPAVTGPFPGAKGVERLRVPSRLPALLTLHLKGAVFKGAGLLHPDPDMGEPFPT